MKAVNAQALAKQARAAAEVRAYETDPDVVALRVEKVRTVSNRLIWSGIVIGLGFTMINVQVFAADHAQPWTLKWLAAWLLDPMVSLVVVGILLAEGVTSRWQVATGGWIRTAKWYALAATYAMNTWSAWSEVIGARFTAGWDHAVQHSVPVGLVLVSAEAGPILRDRLTEAVRIAAQHAAAHRAEREASPVTAHDDAQPSPLTSAAPLTAHPIQPAAVSTAAAAERPATVSAAPLTALVAQTDDGRVADAELASILAAYDDEERTILAAAQVLTPTSFPAGERRTLRLVAPASQPVSGPVAPVSHQVSAVETTDETDAETRMRAYWDREVVAGRVPTGADLVRAALPAKVSPATGRRRRANWEAELVGATPGGGVDAASA